MPSILSTSRTFLLLFLFLFVKNSSQNMSPPPGAYMSGNPPTGFANPGEDFGMTDLDNPANFQVDNTGPQHSSPMAQIAELMVPGSMDGLWDQSIHGLNSEAPKRKVPAPAVQLPPKPEEIPKILLVVWDRNSEIMDDPHIVLRLWTEEMHNDHNYELPMAKAHPLKACAHEFKLNPNEECDYDLLVGSGLVNIGIRNDRQTGQFRKGKIEISYAERKDGPRVSYIEDLERLTVASNPGRIEHQDFHQKHMPKINVMHKNILYLHYHPFEPYTWIYHIHGLVFWRGLNFQNRGDAMPHIATDPFVHIEYVSDHEHVMSKLPYEMDHDPNTGEFRITIRNGYGLNEQRKAEDEKYGKINIAIAANPQFFAARYYRVYEINVLECIEKARMQPDGQKHAYSKDNPGQILYLWADKEKHHFGPYPLEANANMFNIKIARGNSQCHLPFQEHSKVNQLLTIKDENDEEILPYNILQKSSDGNTFAVQIQLGPNIAEGLKIRLDCGSGADTYASIFFDAILFKHLANHVEVPLQTQMFDIENQLILPEVKIQMWAQPVQPGQLNPARQMQNKFKHAGHGSHPLHPNPNGKAFRSEDCGPGVARDRMGEPCNSLLHAHGHQAFPYHLAKKDGTYLHVQNPDGTSALGTLQNMYSSTANSQNAGVQSTAFVNPSMTSPPAGTNPQSMVVNPNMATAQYSQQPHEVAGEAISPTQLQPYGQAPNDNPSFSFNNQPPQSNPDTNSTADLLKSYQNVASPQAQLTNPQHLQQQQLPPSGQIHPQAQVQHLPGHVHHTSAGHGDAQQPSSHQHNVASPHSGQQPTQQSSGVYQPQPPLHYVPVPGYDIGHGYQPFTQKHLVPPPGTVYSYGPPTSSGPIITGQPTNTQQPQQQPYGQSPPAQTVHVPSDPHAYPQPHSQQFNVAPSPGNPHHEHLLHATGHTGQGQSVPGMEGQMPMQPSVSQHGQTHPSGHPMGTQPYFHATGAQQPYLLDPSQSPPAAGQMPPPTTYQHPPNPTLTSNLPPPHQAFPLPPPQPQ